MAECSALNRTFTQPTLRLGEQRGKGSERMHKPEEGKEKACEMPGHDSHYNMNSQQQLPALDLTRVNHGQRRVSQGPIPSWTTYWLWMNSSGQDQSAMN